MPQRDVNLTGSSGPWKHDVALPEGSLNRIFRSSFPDFEGTGFRTDQWRFGVARTADEHRPIHATMLHALAAAAKLESKAGITLLPERDGAPEITKSYREIYHEATRMAGALAALGVQRGDCVLLVLPTSHEFVTAFFAVQLCLAVPVPSYPPAGLRMAAGLERLGHIAGHAAIRLCVTSAELRPLLGELALRAKSLQHMVTVEELASAPKNETKFRAHAADPALIQYTSGSTGSPKGVVLSHANLVSNIHAAGQAMELTRKDVLVSWCPLYHDMGLIGMLLLAVYWRTPVVLLTPSSFLSRPVRWLRAIQKYRGSVSTAPNFGYALCTKRIKPEERAGLDLSSWRLALNGAEPVIQRTVQDFCETYAPHGFRADAVLPVYGLAEATVGVAFPRVGAPLRWEQVDRDQLANGRAVLTSGKSAMTVVSVGRAVPGHAIAVVDEKGKPLPEREVGHVLVSGHSVMKGYFQNQEATDHVLRAGWLWTGDLGYFADQQLYVTGRAKDLIIVRGRNLYAEDVEHCAERVDGVRAGGAVAFGVYDEEQATEVVVLVCETKLGGKKERADLALRVAEVVGEQCDVRVEEVVLVAPGTVPKTPSGKRQRSLCRELYLKDKLRPPTLGKVKLGVVFVRSGAGRLLMRARSLLGGRREPD